MYPILLEWFRKKPVLREVARADVAETAGAPPSPPHVPAATPPAPISTPAATDEDDIDWAAIFARIPKGSKLPRIRRAPKPPDVVKSKKYVEACKRCVESNAGPDACRPHWTRRGKKPKNPAERRYVGTCSNCYAHKRKCSHSGLDVPVVWI